MSEPAWTLNLGDCLDPGTGLASLADKSVDAVVTDPPYGIMEARRRHRGEHRVWGRGGGAIVDTARYEAAAWDDAPASPEAIDHIRRVSHWQIIFGGNYFALPPSRCWLVWDKDNGSTDFADAELAWTNMPSVVRVKRYTWNGMLRGGPPGTPGREPGSRVHPTQKPIAVMEWAIRLLPAGATIVDPFAGSGTTGVAAIRLGRRFIGWEKDPKYHAIAVKRLTAAREQLELCA